MDAYAREKLLGALRRAIPKKQIIEKKSRASYYERHFVRFLKLFKYFFCFNFKKIAAEVFIRLSYIYKMMFNESSLLQRCFCRTYIKFFVNLH